MFNMGTSWAGQTGFSICLVILAQKRCEAERGPRRCDVRPSRRESCEKGEGGWQNPKRMVDRRGFDRDGRTVSYGGFHQTGRSLLCRTGQVSASGGLIASSYGHLKFGENHTGHPWTKFGQNGFSSQIGPGTPPIPHWNLIRILPRYP